ncbi:response regulator transcription factor [Dehalobacter sp. DCM]|uniref:response regulator transcription factor n=1 Tax=Dehalobacter sp. DCM TaxID=2907827 RepID=UPI003081B91B|nr:response regulator transcription factor [Dehalobacter sp. DCM]
MEKNKIRVMIVDDHSIVRDGLKLILGSDEHIQIIGEAKDLRETMEILAEQRPDVLLLDFKLPDSDGITGCQTIKSRYPSIKIIILTAYSQDHIIIETLKAGASGYLLKNIKSEELIQSIIKVYEGNSILDSSVTESILQQIILPPEKNIPKETVLSTKETQIMDMVSIGKSNKEIARLLLISEKTVRNYISTIFRKLNVTNRTEAASYWIRKKNLNE